MRDAEATKSLNSTARRLAHALHIALCNVRESLATERAIPEDSDIIRNESTRIHMEYLTGAVHMLERLPAGLRTAVLIRVGHARTDTIIPDLSTFDPWEGHELEEA